jgi:hypothetical protein
MRQHHGDEIFLTIILHPDECCPKEDAHPLYAFSLDEVRKNIAYLLETLDARGLVYRSLRMSDVLRVWSPRQIQEY